MKFTGQVRIPEVDHPGVPATIVVEDDQTEVFLEGESLGRWSLYDVQASRLVSAAFSISLAGEEITFIADEPVDFAYRGVDHMASVWARYKSMTIPRRVVAVGRSRRGATPSRISELREAMLQNLEAAGRATTIRPIESAREEPNVVTGWSKRLEAYSSVPAPIEEVADAPSAAEIDQTRLAENAAEPREAEQVAPEVEQVAPPVIEVVAADDRVAAVIEPTIAEPPQSRIQPPSPIEPGSDVPAPPQDRDLTSPAPRLRPGPGLVRRRTSRRPEPDVPRQAAPVAPMAREPAAEPAPDAVFEPPTSPDVEPETAAAAPETEEPRPELVVDLGRLEDGGDEGGGEEQPDAERPASSPGKEPVLAGAPSAPTPGGERSGLLGAVRSAFARNRTAHVHEFVEAPGGIGIVRQICSECGYISIGVSD